jgi:hypothetical protein
VASVTHTKYADTTMSVFAPAWMLQVNGVGDTHGSTPATVYVACWTTTLATAATRSTSQLSCRDPLTASNLVRPPVESLRETLRRA